MDYRTPKCTHNEKGMCIHCLVNRGKKEKTAQQKNSNKIEEEHPVPIKKCKHPSNMKCINCLSSTEAKSKCQHPDYEMCKNCENRIKYTNIQEYLQKLAFECKHNKKPCKKCVAPLNRKTYSIDRTCRNHLPYPQAQCDQCMTPTITIQKQQYSHVHKVHVKTQAIYKCLETKAIGVLLGTIQEAQVKKYPYYGEKKGGHEQSLPSGLNGCEITIYDVYFPSEQEVVQGYYIGTQHLSKYTPIFNYFGLREVGIIYNSEHITSMNLLMSSLLQQSFSTLIATSSNEQPSSTAVEKKGSTKNISTSSIETQQISRFITMRLQDSGADPHFQCFMLSDQFLSFHRHQLIYEKNEENCDYFDLVTAKQEDRLSECPTFLRNGSQTDCIYFKEIIMWIPTVYGQSQSYGCYEQKLSNSVEKMTKDHPMGMNEEFSKFGMGQFNQTNQTVYPFFGIESQTLDHLKILVDIDVRDPLQKYRNIQFLLHLCQLIGMNNVVIFLNDFFLDNPDLFLREKIALCEKIEKGQRKQRQNPSIYSSNFIGEESSLGMRRNNSNSSSENGGSGLGGSLRRRFGFN